MGATAGVLRWIIQGQHERVVRAILVMIQARLKCLHAPIQANLRQIRLFVSLTHRTHSIVLKVRRTVEYFVINIWSILSPATCRLNRVANSGISRCSIIIEVIFHHGVVLSLESLLLSNDSVGSVPRFFPCLCGISWSTFELHSRA